MLSMRNKLTASEKKKESLSMIWLNRRKRTRAWLLNLRLLTSQSWTKRGRISRSSETSSIWRISRGTTRLRFKSCSSNSARKSKTSRTPKKASIICKTSLKHKRLGSTTKKEGLKISRVSSTKFKSNWKRHKIISTQPTRF